MIMRFFFFLIYIITISLAVEEDEEFQTLILNLNNKHWYFPLYVIFLKAVVFEELIWVYVKNLIGSPDLVCWVISDVARSLAVVRDRSVYQSVFNFDLLTGLDNLIRWVFIIWVEQARVVKICGNVGYQDLKALLFHLWYLSDHSNWSSELICESVL